MRYFSEMSKQGFRGLGDYLKNVRVKADKKLHTVTTVAFEMLVSRSPVDTARFRGNWNGSVHGVDRKVDLEGQQASDGGLRIGSPVTGREKVNLAPALKARIGQDVYISNDLDYGPGLEAGTGSPQAPFGMLHITRRILNAQMGGKFQ